MCVCMCVDVLPVRYLMILSYKTLSLSASLAESLLTLCTGVKKKQWMNVCACVCLPVCVLFCVSLDGREAVRKTALLKTLVRRR